MEEKGKSEGVRLSSIDVLKGICIIFVIITHFNWKDEERLKYLFPFWIGMAIPVFMMLSGYVNALSFKRHNIDNIEKAYDFKNIIAKYIRFTIPFAVVFLLDGIVSKDFHILKKDGPLGVICSFARGGYGAGSYYYPFLIQFIFLFPIVYFVIHKYDLRGYIYCGIINLVYEFIIRAYGVNLRTYRIVVLRYLWVIAFGIFLAIGKKKISKLTYIFMLIIGSIYIVLFLYTGEKPFITKWWIGTNMWASLFIIPIIVLFISVNISCLPIEIIGKSSYHIFLVQMIYYNHEHFFTQSITKRYEKLLVNVIVCTCIGVLFYLIENPMSTIVRNKIKSNKRNS